MSAFWISQARRHALPGLCVRSVRHSAVRRFACLSVHVDCNYRAMPVDRLRLTFETVGKVWDVIPVEKKTSGATLTQALVRFYDGDYTPGASPSDPPLSLPRPIASEVNTVRGYVNAAVERFNMSIFNGKEIHVCQYYDSSPTQLHKWYEDMRIAEAEQNSSLVLQNAGIFPINPFYAPSENTNDYQKGFEEGFKLGMKDGLKDVR